jgi:hypothetical protein
MTCHLQTKHPFDFNPVVRSLSVSVGAGSFTKFEIVTVYSSICRKFVTRPCNPRGNQGHLFIRIFFVWSRRARVKRIFTLKGGLDVYEQFTINGHPYGSVNEPTPTKIYGFDTQSNNKHPTSDARTFILRRGYGNLQTRQ